MSFEQRFEDRFERFIKPAIEGAPLAGRCLSAFRVDNSRTGDSILTDIADGVSHSVLFLADVSVIDEGRYAEQPFRNGNVMYEVGMALACRQPSEVLLIRDDRKKFLFDVSTIPHMFLGFRDVDADIRRLRTALTDRLLETKKVFDARVTMALAALTSTELKILRSYANSPERRRDFTNRKLGTLSLPIATAVSALLAKGCVRSVGVSEKTEAIVYAVTPFGLAVAEAARLGLMRLKPD